MAHELQLTDGTASMFYVGRVPWQAFLPGMMERRWGRVVNVASIAGLRGDRYISAYAASKHALVGLSTEGI